MQPYDIDTKKMGYNKAHYRRHNSISYSCNLVLALTKGGSAYGWGHFLAATKRDYIWGYFLVAIIKDDYG